MNQRFSRDVMWNVASLGIAGVCGLGVNFLISHAYGTTALGVFNQVFAAYMIFSQLAALGVHTSILTHGAAAPEHERRAIFTAGLVVLAAQATVVAVVFAAAAPLVGRLVDSPDVSTGMLWAAPGLLCFAVNKGALAILNSLQRMRLYAVFQGGRVVMMCVAFGAFVLADLPVVALPVILSLGEGTVLAGALLAIRRDVGRGPVGAWPRRHFRFGARGFLSGLFTDLSTRSDVLILGVFAADNIVGAYSFAAIMAEGVYQVLIALRTNYAPILVRQLAAGGGDVVATVARARTKVYVGAAAVAVVAIAGYALVVPLISADPLVRGSWVYFAIILGGMAASAGYAPFAQLLLWAGRPGWHTILVAVIVGVGTALDLVMVRAWGPEGAAIAVALTYAWSVVALRLLVGRVLQLRI
ncbi:MAG: oligosaccharide flippase family protein [Deltaproteobacteria bacterium]|nr:oligosaccharide flippase family protein [Deltaproteobacteria bacterium]